MNKKVYVWDRFVRLFHWLLVAAFVTSYLSGESESSLHVYSGYLILSLLIARLVWGVIGSRYARFRDFVRPPAAAIGYLKGLPSGRSPRYIGHNPAGGWMVLALLAGLFTTGLSGLKLYGLEGYGPLAVAEPAVSLSSHDDHDEEEEDEEEEEEIWEEVHEFFANLMVALIALHIAGVMVSSLVHRENLVRAMVSGYKQRGDSPEN